MDRAKRVSGVGSNNRRRVQKSTTLNRKYVSRVGQKKNIKAAVADSPKKASAMQLKQAKAKSGKSIPNKKLSQQDIARIRAQQKIALMQKQKNKQLGQRQLTSKELKERAIKQALASAKAEQKKQNKKSVLEQNIETSFEKKTKKHFWQKKSAIATIVLIFVALGALGTFTYLNLPDLTVKVAAIRSGFDAKYPSYTPVGYKTSSIDVDNGAVKISYKNEEGKEFLLTEEKTTWDSATLLDNFVEKEWGQNYEIMKGQGLTIYLSNKGSAWVNGGVLYKVYNKTSELTNEQIHGLVVSL